MPLTVTRDQGYRETACFFRYRLQERIRQKLEARLRGFEYRQQGRKEHRAARQKAYRITSMMREQGTLRGARKYLDFKGIPYRQDSDRATGITTLMIPGQITLRYDPQGRFLASGPPGASSAGG